MLGLSPRDVDKLSFSELYMMLAGAHDREKRKWEHTLAICTMIGNVHGAFGKHSKPLDYLHKQMFGYPRPSDAKITEWKTKIAAIKTRLNLDDGSKS